MRADATRESTVKRKRHSAPEIVAKLHRADQMAADGMLHSDIARALGVSVMTYHRWRASRSAARSSGAAAEEAKPRVAPTLGPPQTSELDRLRLENGRLRRLLTDLLLEKAKLEEMLTPHGVGSNPGGLDDGRRDDREA